MTLADTIARWQERREEWSRLGVVVDGVKIANQVLADLAKLDVVGAQEALTLADAAKESGYSSEHLRHLVASGKLENVGRKHAPRVRRADLPRKCPVEREGHYDADADALSLVAHRKLG
jgi:hypothetical protein